MTRSGANRAAIIGGGVIGGGWAARFLLHGWDVSVYDPDPAAEQKIQAVLERARRFLPALADVAMPPEGQLHMSDSIAAAVQDARWIQESVGERLGLKHKVIAEIQASAADDALLGSSTSGFRPSQLAEGAPRPQNILVAHPFNPVYLLPVVEVVGSEATALEMMERAEQDLTSVGMKPLVIDKEIDAHVADRLLESVWREALWLVRDDVATTKTIDDVIRFGFGLRWAQMGLFETYRLAGGDDGMHHFLEQFGPTLSWPWTRLMDVPELDQALIAKITQQSDTQSGHMSIAELADARDRNLVAMMRALKKHGWGAGELLQAHDKHLKRATAGKPVADSEASGLLRLYDIIVPQSWLDYNGHMTEHRYLEVFGYTTDALLEEIGVNADYVGAGHSYYTVETHIQHLDEARLGEQLTTTTQLVFTDDKRLHLFHSIHSADKKTLLATAEQMLLHVDSHAGRACAAAPDVLERLRSLQEEQAHLDKPGSLGRFVGQR